LLVVMLAFGLAAPVVAASSARLATREDEPEAKPAAERILTAIELERKAIFALTLSANVSSMTHAEQYAVGSDIVRSHTQLRRAADQDPALAPDMASAEGLDVSAYGVIHLSTTGNVNSPTHPRLTNAERDKIVELLTRALQIKYRAEAHAEAAAAYEGSPQSSSSPGCKVFDPDPVVTGEGLETIALDDCPRVRIEVDGETPASKLTGDWGAASASGSTSGTCRQDGGMLECTPTPSASAEAVVFGSALPAGTHLSLVLMQPGSPPQTVQYVVPGKASTKPPAPAPTGQAVKLEVELSCGNVRSDPISVSDPSNGTPVIYAAQFKPHGFCGTNSETLIDASTGKELPPNSVVFPPDTVATADQYSCAQHQDLTGCEGQGADSQMFVFGITVTNLKP
jgi:hypothetical protein